MARIPDWRALGALASLAAFALHAAVPADYVATVERARAERVDELKRADGYLTLTASGWLEKGANSIGSAGDNRFIVAGAPAHLGSLSLAADGQVTLHLGDVVGITVDGRAAGLVEPLHTQIEQAPRQPTRVGFGSSYLYVIANGTQRGLRVKNHAAPLRTAFPGFDYFPIDTNWRIEAEWVPFAQPKMLPITYVTGTQSDMPVAGKAVFHRDGQRYELLPIEEDGQLFFVFTDRTAGRLTYGGARFLYADAPKDGKVLLDFNLAQNPPCAITPHVVCPLAPPENRLKVAVTAGELKFQAADE